MGFGKANLGNKEVVNQVLYKYSNLLGFPCNHKTSFCPLYATNCFLSMCLSTFIFLDHHKVSPTLAPRVGKLVAMLRDFIVKVLFIFLQLFLSCRYPMVSLINFPISWRYGVTQRLIALCSRMTCSRIDLLHIFSNVVGTLIVQKITLPP
jgi:hypothetical protein